MLFEVYLLAPFIDLLLMIVAFQLLFCYFQLLSYFSVEFTLACHDPCLLCYCLLRIFVILVFGFILSQVFFPQPLPCSPEPQVLSVLHHQFHFKGCVLFPIVVGALCSSGRSCFVAFETFKVFPSWIFQLFTTIHVFSVESSSFIFHHLYVCGHVSHSFLVLANKLVLLFLLWSLSTFLSSLWVQLFIKHSVAMVLVNVLALATFVLIWAYIFELFCWF